MDEQEKPVTPVAPSRTVVSPQPLVDGKMRQRRVVQLSKHRLEEQGLKTKRCPMCGVNPAGEPRSRLLSYVPPWVWVGFLINILVLAVLVLATRKHVKTELALCEDCAKADRNARNLRGGSVAGLICGPFLGMFAGAMLAPQTGLLWGLGIGSVAGLVGLFAAHLHTRFDLLTVKKIDRQRVILEGTGHLPEVLEAEGSELLLAGTPID